MEIFLTSSTHIMHLISGISVQYVHIVLWEISTSIYIKKLYQSIIKWIERDVKSGLFKYWIVMTCFTIIAESFLCSIFIFQQSTKKGKKSFSVSLPLLNDPSLLCLQRDIQLVHSVIDVAHQVSVLHIRNSVYRRYCKQ